MAFFDFVRKIIPGWANKAPRQHWGAYFDAVALFVDALVELADEARTAALPGQVELPGIPNLGGFWSIDALPLIGDDRMVVKGLAESWGHYAERLRRYRDDWRLAGTAFGLLEQLAGVLSAPGHADPLLRVVTANGRWYTRHPDGTLRLQTPTGRGFYLAPDGTSGIDTTAAQAWDWDSLTVPPPGDQNDATRFWVLVYPPAAGPYLVEDDHTFNDPGLVGDGWNDLAHGGYEESPDEGTVGTNAPIQLVELARAVIQQRRCVGYRAAWVVIAFDPASFNPDGSSTGTNPYPDGYWGHHTKVAAGPTKVPARLATAEYWPAAPGGLAL